MLEKELARTAVLVEKLQSAREGHRVGKKNISKMLLRAQFSLNMHTRILPNFNTHTAFGHTAFGLTAFGLVSRLGGLVSRLG